MNTASTGSSAKATLFYFDAEWGVTLPKGSKEAKATMKIPRAWARHAKPYHDTVTIMVPCDGKAALDAIVNAPTAPKPKRVEIAYMGLGRDNRLAPKRKTVTASALVRTLERLREDGAINIVTRDAEG
jgi:hypothetical protein